MRRRFLLAALGLGLLVGACMQMQAGGGAGANATSAALKGPKYTYVLVHGAWAGGWEWKKVGDILEADGNKVYRPTLTGQGERMHLASPDIDLDTHIMDVVNVIRFEDLHDVVLMGHSYGGMVITGVADRVPERIKCLVYVDAFLPENGESLNALTAAGRGGRGAASGPAATGRAGGRGRGPAMRIVNGFSVPNTRPGMQPPYDVPQSVKTFSEPESLTNPAARRIPAVYIVMRPTATQPVERAPFYRYYQRAEAKGWTTWSMVSGHVVNLEHPAEIAALLEKAPAAAKVGPGL